MSSVKLDNQIKDLEREIEHLTLTLASKKAELIDLRKTNVEIRDSDALTNDEISRFSRQLILPEIGVKGQLKLRNANVLIVGAGGLGKFFSWE